jgi:PhzF family phenazine biosynthesis protein
MHVQRFAAFADGAIGGNPAGVVLCADGLPSEADMQRVAAAVGYSETAFAAPLDGAWRVRYFAPALEVPFCGHATLALGAALALVHGDRVFPLVLNDGPITVEGWRAGPTLMAALQSPPTRSAPAAPALVGTALALFGYAAGDLDPALPPALMEAGARHLLLALASERALAAMRYDLAAGRELMLAAGLATICLARAQAPSEFLVRNAFAAGGIYEDPATGAAAAALAGYLRDRDWPHGGAIELRQGLEMGVPSRLRAEIPPARGASVRVIGSVRPIG